MSLLSRRALLDSPAAVVVTPVSDTRIDVSWLGVITAASYRVYRNGVLVDSPSGLTSSSTGLTGSTLYTFQVACVDDAGQEGPKTPATTGTTFQTPDVTAPSVPTITTGAVTSSSVVLNLTVPSTDSGSGVSSYTLQRATNSTFTLNLVTTNGLTAFPTTISNLLPSTQYFFRLRAVDGASNIGNFSALVSATTTAAATSWWPNWPIMNTTCLQGALDITNTALYAELADKDAMVCQGWYPTTQRNQARIDWLAGVRAINPRFKVMPHVMAQETLKVAQSPPQNSELEIAYDILNSPTEGRESWYVHRVGQPTSAGRVESNNDSANKHQVNMACLVSGLNSLGENYAQAFWRKWETLWSNPQANILPLLDGAFQDNFNQRPPEMYIGNGATQVTDHDFDGTGTIDSRTDFSAGANAGGRFWAQGHVEFKNRFDERFPDKVLIPNAARFDVDYLDGVGAPPLPFSSSAFSRMDEMHLREHSNLALGIQVGASSYSFNGGGSATSFFRRYEIQERFLKLDANNTKTGKGCVMLHANGINRSPVAADYTFARFISALALLVERGAPCVQLGGVRPLSLDECLLELGSPDTTRTMGTLNENTGTFSLRTADQSVGVARFYWAAFAKGLVVARCDSPSIGAYPTADAAVTCTLPFPCIRINAAIYVNPVTGRSMRGQDTTINNGAAATTVSLRPYEAIFLIRA